MLLAGSRLTYLVLNCLLTAAGAFSVAPALSYIADLVPPRTRATATALTLLGTNSVGFAFGPYCIGKVSDLLARAGMSSGEALRTAMLLALTAIPLAVILNLIAARDANRVEQPAFA